MRRPGSIFLSLALLFLGSATPAASWFADGGHDRITAAAVELLPPEMPRFFRKSCAKRWCWKAGDALSEAAKSPDAFKVDALVQLHAQESPEHYIDLELFGGDPLPPERYAYVEALVDKEVAPERIGFLPYAIAEWSQRLTMTFLRLRRHPGDPGLEAQALTYGGILAHYAEDLAQPLHTSIHHNGRAEPPDWKSPRTGIHFAVDALVGDLEPTLPEDSTDVDAFDDLWSGILTALEESHRMVDDVYALETEPGSGEVDPGSPEARRFTRERYEAAARFTARLWLTAWERSGELELPEWMEELVES